jgi:regulator of cell morphogenesis and NO signaling
MPTTDVPPIDVQRTLGDLVAERPARARVLERAGLDYCCKGQRTLADASATAGLDADALARDLAGVVDEETDIDVTQFDPAELVDHIVDTHHAYLHEELPLLDALATKVRDVHRNRHPELVEVARLVNEIRLDLEPHLAKEERVLFPAIRATADGVHDFAFGSISNPIAVMLGEHDRAGDLLARLRRAANDYVVPDDACTSYRMLYERLAHLEADTHRHIHLENNVLFPAVVADER